MTLRERALELLLLTDADCKARETRALDCGGPVDPGAAIAEPAGVPGRPTRPVLVPHAQLKRGSLATREGHAALLHSVVHIEFNAIKMVPDAKVSAAGHTVGMRCMKSGQQPFGICAKLTHNTRRPPPD